MKNTSEPLIQTKHLFVRLQGKVLLQDITFSIKPGEIISIIGPNGAGKTTFLKALLGLVPIAEGKVARAPYLKIGYMPQKLHIDPNLPLCVNDFLRMGYQKHDLTPILEELKITHLLSTSMQNLSGGEHQRVLLARALIPKPNLLILDEPAQGVDLKGQAEVYHLIASIRDHYRCAVLIVSHNLQIVMAKTDYVICLQRHICCHGEPKNISVDPAFTDLFGQLPGLALYTHQHDHQHDMHGKVIKEQDDER